MATEEKTIRCPLCNKCGGCNMRGESYKENAKKKEDWVNEVLADYAEANFDGRIHLTQMKNPYHYRHKVNSAFGRLKDGTIISGVYKEYTRKICQVDECFIQHEIADAIIADIRKLVKSFKIKVYNENSGIGLLRHVQIRISHATQKAMVILVLTDQILPSKNNFVKELVKLHPEIETIIINVNDAETSMVLGDRNITIYGSGHIKDELCGIKYEISPGDFYQVNPEMTERIYETAIEFAKLKKTDVVLDAYSGIGTIGLTAASKVKQVVGVELNGDAVKDANTNARKNGINNARFMQGDAGRYMEGLAETGEHLDVVFMDPPRSGSTAQFIAALHTAAPDRIVYISCNPETMVEDLDMITEGDRYKVKRIVAFDQFAWTNHCETVCLLSRKDLN